VAWGAKKMAFGLERRGSGSQDRSQYWFARKGKDSRRPKTAVLTNSFRRIYRKGIVQRGGELTTEHSRLELDKKRCLGKAEGRIIQKRREI